MLLFPTFFSSSPIIVRRADSPRLVRERHSRGRRSSVGKYEFSGLVASHSRARVVQVQSKSNPNQTLALKILERVKDEDVLKQEMVYHVRCHAHPHVTTCFDVMKNKEHMFLVTEYADDGCVFNHVEGYHPHGLNEGRAMALLCQLLSAVRHIHDQGIAHRDIKPENLLLSDSGHKLLVCDFGSATQWQPGTPEPSDVAGTIVYMCPEMLLGRSSDGKTTRPYNPQAVDVWGCGVSLFFMLTGTVPFLVLDDDDDLSATVTNIVNAKSRFPLPASIPVGLSHLLHRMLEPNPAKRATVRELCDHPLVRHHSAAFPGNAVHRRSL